ncbi:hypothetical protein [Stakelama pacifica]|uniref:Uncharacterized protein n=1 Tax=Stakelama pacifica TaxID=517720 RepID=A0A4V3BTD1_9SPHN|nr:hypothetical protein [Stakelama pacifica]TDN82888.1 hypothetical protein EV664_10585 [Stakelama pacifica]GGO95296.1 hypothetical protein GCM10011329_19150 [Stakelama pacifica]
MTAKPSNRQIMRYFLGGFAIGAIGLFGIQGVQASSTHAPAAPVAVSASR